MRFKKGDKLICLTNTIDNGKFVGNGRMNFTIGNVYYVNEVVIFDFGVFIYLVDDLNNRVMVNSKHFELFKVNRSNKINDILR